MGKNIISQRRGRGTSTYRAPSHRYVAKVSYRKYDQIEKTGVIYGKIVDLVHCPGHFAPLAKIKYNDNNIEYLIAPEGIYVNKIVASGFNAPPEQGNVLPLEFIPMGTSIFNIEGNPGDGGKFIRASGSSAVIVAKSKGNVTILFPSKKQKDFNPMCRATIGIIAGSGRKEKPFVKAGNRHYAMKAKNKLYPLTSGVAMNAVDHPFGSGRGRHIGKPKTPSRFAPPGRKVGSIRARRTGHKK